MYRQLLGLALLLVLACAAGEKVRFDGHKVVRLNVADSDLHDTLSSMEPDVWSHDGSLPSSGVVDLRLSKEQLAQLSDAGVPFQVLINDVQAIIDHQEEARVAKRAAALADNEDEDDSLADEFFDDYHDFEEIVYETRRLVDQFDDIVTFIPSIGKSIEGRDIVGVHIHAGPFAKSKRANKPLTATPKLWFQGGQHAREWIGPMTVMYILTEFLSGYGTDENITAILDATEVFIVPVVNPDGLDWAFTDNRLWRKNRRQVTSSTFGVDLNRNWDDHWGGGGSSSNPSSDTYRGTGPFSEPESKAVSDFIVGLGDSIIAGIDFHSYSQLILRPYGWSDDVPPNEVQAKAVGAAMQTAIRRTHGKGYTNEGAWELYIAAGGASDWFYSGGKMPLSYTIELRDTGTYGFLLPATQIVPTGEEALAATIALAQAAIKAQP